MTDIAALAGIVEGLSGADREVDCLIVCAIDRRPEWLAKSEGHLWLDRSQTYPVVRFADERIGKSRGNPSVNEVPAYTSSVDAALTLVPEGWGWLVSQPSAKAIASGLLKERTPVRGEVYYDIDRRFVVAAATPALALTAAALRARSLANTGESL